MTSAAHVKLSQADIDESTPEELAEDEFGYSLSELSCLSFVPPLLPLALRESIEI